MCCGGATLRARGNPDPAAPTLPPPFNHTVRAADTTRAAAAAAAAAAVSVALPRRASSAVVFPDRAQPRLFDRSASFPHSHARLFHRPLARRADWLCILPTATAATAAAAAAAAAVVSAAQAGAHGYVECLKRFPPPSLQLALLLLMLPGLVFSAAQALSSSQDVVSLARE
jgi:hypothetical protein